MRRAFVTDAVLESDLAKKRDAAADILKRLETATARERKALLDMMDSELKKAYWSKKSKEERSAIMRKVAAGGKQAKPLKRCPCGVMTLARAIKRRHVVDGQCRPGVGL